MYVSNGSVDFERRGKETLCIWETFGSSIPVLLFSSPIVFPDKVSEVHFGQIRKNADRNATLRFDRKT